MATRRVRRDSETSTDSWSLVEEDHLSDDISVHSTEEESDDDHEEPIIEEPPTSDDETASEDSESDSECDSDSESDSESDEEEQEEKADSEEISESEEEDSDLEIQEEILKEEEDVEEEEEMSEEEKEAVRKCKEEDWYNEGEEEEEEYDQEDEVNRIHPIPLAIALAFMFGFFVAADRYTSYLIKKEIDGPFGVFGDYSQQSYNSKKVSKWGFRQVETVPTRYDYLGRPLDPFTMKPKKLKFPYVIRMNLPPHLDPIARQHARDAEVAADGLYPFVNDTTRLPVNWINIWRADREIPALFKEKKTSLAPVPPAPFTPRRAQKWVMPRYQPCLVHVNESKWTCQKNVPAVYYSQSHLIKKWKKMGRTGGVDKEDKKHICGKKASESMRIISKPTDQCESRHFSKYTPRRKHIAFKTPLPCKAPNYKPSHPKPTKKPSSSDDWYSKRSQVRAQLRSRA